METVMIILRWIRSSEVIHVYHFMAILFFLVAILWLLGAGTRGILG